MASSRGGAKKKKSSSKKKKGGKKKKKQHGRGGKTQGCAAPAVSGLGVEIQRAGRTVRGAGRGERRQTRIRA